MKRGGGLLVKVRRTATKITCDAFNVSGKITLTSPTLVINLLLGEFQAGDELPLFTGAGKITLTGTPEITPERPAPGLLWDTSRLAAEGILAVVADPDGVEDVQQVSSDATETYDLNGRKITNDYKPRGVFIRDNRKWLRR